MQFDMAGSVDWPIIDKITVIKPGDKREYITLDDKTREMRRNLTLELAQDFVNKARKRRDLNFVPFGTIQGYSPSTYRDSMRKILKMGYEYIAIGGLPAYSEKEVIELLPIIQEEIDRAGYRPGIHLYGRFPSPSKVGYYLQNYVSSFDNNSSFISAAQSPCAYYDPEFLTTWETPSFLCSGAKIPPLKGPLLSRLKRRDPDLHAKVAKKCDKTFKMFCEFARSGKTGDLKDFLRQYKRMNKAINAARLRPISNNQIVKINDRAKAALKNKGWERCDCEACEICGPHIVLVRGQRIPYLFLHNTYVQFARFQQELKKAKENVNYNQYDWSKIKGLNKLKNNRRAVKNVKKRFTTN
jgi:hypothetical protein